MTITEGKVVCAIIASELRAIAESSEAYLIKRVSDIYDCAVKNGHDVLVLGAWGCGAFKETEDDAEIIANVFKKVAAKYADRIVSVFAVLYKKNFKTFKEILGE